MVARWVHWASEVVEDWPDDVTKAPFEIAWVSGRTAKKLLADDVDGAAVEGVNYVPQSYLEKVCNEIGGSQHDGFAKELRSVIFSHVEEADRLGHPITAPYGPGIPPGPFLMSSARPGTPRRGGHR